MAEIGKHDNGDDDCDDYLSSTELLVCSLYVGNARNLYRSHIMQLTNWVFGNWTILVSVIKIKDEM
jgi:hypothetical protein